MKSNAERMNLVFARAKKIKYCGETKKLNFCKVATALLSVLLLCCTALFPTSYKSAAVAGYCGAILLIDGMCGYVLTAVVTFIIATVITVMCIKIKTGGTENEQKIVSVILSLCIIVCALPMNILAARPSKTQHLPLTAVKRFFCKTITQAFISTICVSNLYGNGSRAIAKETGEVFTQDLQAPGCEFNVYTGGGNKDNLSVCHTAKGRFCRKRRTGKIPAIKAD